MQVITKPRAFNPGDPAARRDANIHSVVREKNTVAAGVLSGRIVGKRSIKNRLAMMESPLWTENGIDLAEGFATVTSRPGAELLTPQPARRIVPRPFASHDLRAAMRVVDRSRALGVSGLVGKRFCEIAAQIKADGLRFFHRNKLDATEAVERRFLGEDAMQSDEARRAIQAPMRFRGLSRPFAPCSHSVVMRPVKTRGDVAEAINHQMKMRTAAGGELADSDRLPEIFLEHPTLEVGKFPLSGSRVEIVREGDRQDADRRSKKGGKVGDVLTSPFSPFPVNPAGFYTGAVRVVT